MASTLSPEFAALASRMPPTLKRILVDGGDPSEVVVDQLLAELQLPAALTQTMVMSEPGALSPTACAALRRAVDKERSVEIDSVDGGAEHQLDLSIYELRKLVGAAAVIPFMFVFPGLLAVQMDGGNSEVFSLRGRYNGYVMIALGVVLSVAGIAVTLAEVV